MDEQFADARPGRGHLALASFYRAGKAPGVITQNIDNLHQNSGIAAEHVIELHGNNTYACASTAPSATSWPGSASGSRRQRTAPDCTDCGGPIKTATISFGQAMPEREMRRAEQLTA